MRVKGGSLTVAGLVTGISLYLLAYFLSSEIFNGRLGSDRYRIRVFQSETHRLIFAPLSFFEGLISPHDREFSTQVGNHASLPPPE